jgi:TctA family transporter
MPVAAESLFNLVTSPTLMGLVLLAIPVGLFFGAVPGLGGKLGIVLMIPFVFGMEALPGAVLLLAMHAVVHTGGSIPSILLGIPGTGPDAATVVDGHPMAQKGEANRALGASLAASGVGGVLGAVVLALLLPVLEPLVLAFGPAEFFMLTLLGITFIAALSGSSLIKGLIVGGFGLALAFVGLDPMTGVERYTFGALFLWDGVDVITAVLAFFAIPAMVDLGIKGGAVSTVESREHYRFAEVARGMGDVFRHWSLTFRTAVIGAVIGMIPGLGGDAASWLCYGHAVQSSKTPERFGKGAVEGVIAPEAANNSKEGGSLLPTLMFGIPGSSGMAVMLGALVMLGIQPGPQLIREGLDLVWTLVWVLVVANVLAVLMFCGVARWVGMLAAVRGSLLIPLVFVLAMLGSYLSSGAWQNFLVILVLGALGILMKRAGWPRPPLIVGLVLGSIAEVSLHQSLAIWGPSFVTRPITLVLLALTLANLAWYFWRRRRVTPKRTHAGLVGSSDTAPNRHGLGATLAMTALFAAMVGLAAGYSPDARLFPLIVGVPALALCILQLGGDVARHRRLTALGVNLTSALSDDAKAEPHSAAGMFGWFLVFLGGVTIFGFLIATPILIFAFLRLSRREPLWLSSAMAAGGLAVIYGVFEVGLRLSLHRGLVFDWLGG